MSVAGIDVSTKQVAIVLLDDDTNQAETHTYPLIHAGGDRPAWTAARSVQDVLPRPSGLFWDPVWLIGIEDPMSRGIHAAKTLSLVLGAVLNNLPRDVLVLPMPPTEWKRETHGKPMANKDQVAHWVFRTWQGDSPVLVDQDTIDAFAIAYAARKINSRAVAATR